MGVRNFIVWAGINRGAVLGLDAARARRTGQRSRESRTRQDAALGDRARGVPERAFRSQGSAGSMDAGRRTKRRSRGADQAANGAKTVADGRYPIQRATGKDEARPTASHGEAVEGRGYQDHRLVEAGAEG